MFEIFGIPSQALFGQLLLGLINGSFYALLSLGLAVIFGMLNIINFTHGAQYMMGAFTAYHAAAISRHQLLGGAGHRADPGRLNRHRHRAAVSASGCRSSIISTGLLLTFGLALIIEGLFRNYYGSSGQPYAVPDALQGGHNLGFMFLPNYRAWVIAFSLVVCFRHLVRDRAHAARLLSARRDRKSDAGARLRHQRAAHGDAHLRLRRRACGARRRHGGADLQRLAADGLRLIIVVFAVVVIGGMGSIMGAILTGFTLGIVEGLTKVFFPGSLEHGDLRHHGHCAVDPAGRPVRTERLMATPSMRRSCSVRRETDLEPRGGRRRDAGRVSGRRRRSCSIRSF